MCFKNNRLPISNLYPKNAILALESISTQFRNKVKMQGKRLFLYINKDY